MDDSKFKYDNCGKTLKHFEMDNYKNVACLNGKSLDSLVIDSTKCVNEGLVSLDRLIAMDICQNTKVTTVRLDSLYTPWGQDHAQNLDTVLAKTSNVSGTWNTNSKQIELTKAKTGQRLIVHYNSLVKQVIPANEHDSDFDSD